MTEASRGVRSWQRQDMGLDGLSRAGIRCRFCIGRPGYAYHFRKRAGGPRFVQSQLDDKLRGFHWPSREKTLKSSLALCQDHPSPAHGAAWRFKCRHCVCFGMFEGDGEGLEERVGAPAFFGASRLVSASAWTCSGGWWSRAFRGGLATVPPSSSTSSSSCSSSAAIAIAVAVAVAASHHYAPPSQLTEKVCPLGRARPLQSGLAVCCPLAPSGEGRGLGATLQAPGCSCAFVFMAF